MERTEELTAASAPRREVPGSYVDLPAVLGGAVVAAAAMGLFTVFGAALGLSTISADPGEGSVMLLLIVTAIWTVISTVAAYMAGGYVAGRMRRRLDDAGADEISARDGINGLVVWGLGMLVTAWMAAGALGTAAVATGNAVGGAAQGAGAALGGVADTVASTVGVTGDETDETLGWIGDSLLRGLPGTAAEAPAPAPATGAPPAPVAATAAEGDMSRQTAAILANVMRTGEISEEDSGYLVAATARTTGLSEAEAQTRVDAAISATQEARAEAARLAEEAEQAARDAAETARISAILTAFLLAAASLVAAAASMAGAVRGGRHRDEGRIFGGLNYRL